MVLGEPVQPTDHYNGSPDSILSGPLDMSNSTPNTAESETPTVPFPAVSRSSSPFGTPEMENAVGSRHSPKSKEKEDETTQRAFGSPVPIDEDKPL